MVEYYTCGNVVSNGLLSCGFSCFPADGLSLEFLILGGDVLPVKVPTKYLSLPCMDLLSCHLFSVKTGEVWRCVQSAKPRNFHQEVVRFQTTVLSDCWSTCMKVHIYIFPFVYEPLSMPLYLQEATGEGGAKCTMGPWSSTFLSHFFFLFKLRQSWILN